MFNHPAPNRSKVKNLKKKGIRNLHILINKKNQEKLVKSMLKDVIKHVEKEEVENCLKDISLEEFKDQFPEIKSFILEMLGIYNVYDLSRFVNKTSSKIPGVTRGYEKELRQHLKLLESSIKDKYSLTFNPAEKTKKKERILRMIYELDLKSDFYKDIDEKISKWEEALKTNIIFLNTNIFWSITWYFKDNNTKKKTLKAIEIYKEFLNELDMESLKAKEKQLNKKIETINIWEDFKLNSSKYYAILEKLYGGNINEDTLSGDLNSQLVKSINKLELNEENLKVNLRSWQEFGAKFALRQKRVLIGDEMGLGKTVEALAVMADLKSRGRKHFLVISPASIIINWYREVKKHSKLNPIKLHGPYRDKAMEKWISEGGVGISSYSTVQKLKFSKDMEIDLLVLDEAHYVKNKDAKRSKFSYKLTEHSDYVIYMTGTPIENNLEEMLTLIEKLNKEVILELNKNPLNYKEGFFRELIGPVYLRRNRKDVLKELPELTQIEEWVEFSPEEKRDYIRNLEDGNFMGMRSSGFAGRVRGKSPKINRILEIVEESVKNGNKVIIFSFFRKVLNYLEDELGDMCVGQITGGVSQKERVRILDEFKDSKRKNVLVAQIDAAGVGLNIQQANTVIICEPQLKPSTETQAISRVYRMGQVKNVFVHRILTEDSIDEILMEVLNTKQYVFDTYARKSDIGSKSLEKKKEEEKVIKIQEYIIEKERKKYKNIV